MNSHSLFLDFKDIEILKKKKDIFVYKFIGQFKKKRGNADPRLEYIYTINHWNIGRKKG